MTADDLKKFCADANDIRVYIREPWSDGEFTYATNGHILVRVARLPDVAEQPKAPDAAALLAKVEPAINWMPVPATEMPPMIECDECGGTGVQHENYRGLPIEEDCEWCGHTGKVRQRVGVKVGGVSFDQGYLSMLQGWEISPNGLKPAWIRNGDATGLLMPRNEG